MGRSPRKKEIFCSRHDLYKRGPAKPPIKTEGIYVLSSPWLILKKKGVEKGGGFHRKESKLADLSKKVWE